MPHFLDTLVTNPIDPGLLYSDLMEQLPNAECILADNVYEYFFSQRSGHIEYDNDVGEWVVDVADLTAAMPSIVPPFAATFVTAKQVSLARQRGRARGDIGGVLFVRRPIMDNQHESFGRFLLNDEMATSRLDLQKSGVRWMVYALPFMQMFDKIFDPFVAALLPVTEDGRWFAGRPDQPKHVCIVRDDESLRAYQRWQASLPGTPLTEEDWQKLFTDCMEYWVLPALLTLSFIHCRNVEIIEHDPTPTRQLRRQSERRQERTGFPLIRWRTVQIEPIKRVLHEEGRISEVGLAQALHICRGHFKDYREGAGLFGKHHDVYWWDDHRRGTLEQGAILKDYKAPPHEEENSAGVAL